MSRKTSVRSRKSKRARPSAASSSPWRRFRHRADLYARRVCGDAGAGTRIVAGPLVRLACERHLRDRVAAAGKGGHPKGFWFDEQAADDAIAFFEHVLRLPDTQDSAGDPCPFLLLPFQAFIIGSLDGWKTGAGVRRFREAFLEIGKGNGKTPLAAGKGLKELVASPNGSMANEIYAGATTREQASILFRDAERMVAASPELRAIIEVSAGNLAYAPSQSYFRPVSSEHRGLDGKRCQMGLLDEVQEHPNALVVTKIRAGAKGRQQPQFIELTNSGSDRTSVCWDHHEHSRRVLEGVVEDDAWFAYVCGLDEGDDPLKDSSCWPKANPALGVCIQPEYLARQVEIAKHIPSEANTVLRLNFCVWTQAVSRFFDAAAWSKCAGAVPDAELVGAPCYAGLDLGMSDDFSALVLIWLLDDGRVATRARFWLPTAALERYPHRPYGAWRAGGWLTLTEGNTTDYETLRAEILAECRRWAVRTLGYDRRFAEQLAQQLLHEAVDCVDVPQGFFLNEALRRVNEWVAAGDLCHGGHPVLAWMADNAIVKTGRDQAIRLDKESAREKVDGIAALVMATAIAMRSAAAASPRSVYEERGLTTLGSPA